MKNKIKCWLKSGLFGALALAGTTACTDDHFDIRPEGVAGSRTLWENIQSNGQLDSLAMIMQKTRVMKTNYDNTTTIKYSELLNQPQFFTIWAPKDGTYHAKAYLDRLEEAEALRGSDLNKALDIEYEVAQQFLMNHIARFNYESERAGQDVRMLNSKVCVYDANQRLFNNVHLDAAMGSVFASNGTMHVLDGHSPFAYNLYDYVVANSEYSKLYHFLTDSKYYSREFSEGLSTPGTSNPDGQMEYVDSVWVTYNSLVTESRASLSNEDSLYIALLPTDDAWDVAVQKLRTYFNYGKEYNYEWDASRGEFTRTGANAYKIEDVEALADTTTMENLVKSLYFSSSVMPVLNKRDSAEVIRYALYADSLISTNGVIYYNANANESKTGLNPMFELTEPVGASNGPVKASNGYIFPLRNFTVDPADFWVTRKEYSATNTYNLAQTKNVVNNGEIVYLSSENRNDEVQGEIEDNAYIRFEAKGGDMTIDFALRGVLSGTYRVSAIMAPTRLDRDKADTRPDTEKPEKCVFYVEMLLDTDSKPSAKSENVEISQDRIDRYVLFDKLTFSKCYYGLPNEYDTFPRLRFNIPRKYQSPAPPKFEEIGNCSVLNIVAIVLEPCEE